MADGSGSLGPFNSFLFLPICPNIDNHLQPNTNGAPLSRTHGARVENRQKRVAEVEGVKLGAGGQIGRRPTIGGEEVVGFGRA